MTWPCFLAMGMRSGPTIHPNSCKMCLCHACTGAVFSAAAATAAALPTHPPDSIHVEVRHFYDLGEREDTRVGQWLELLAGYGAERLDKLNDGITAGGKTGVCVCVYVCVCACARAREGGKVCGCGCMSGRGGGQEVMMERDGRGEGRLPHELYLILTPPYGSSAL
jgi:hypothetical protein